MPTRTKMQIGKGDGDFRPTAVPPMDPIAKAVHLRAPVTDGMKEHFAPTDVSPGLEVTRFKPIANLVRSRKFQFFLILPNQIIFWLVIFLGLAGTVVPGLNFGTAITWYVWFALVFVMMVVVGRAWCSMCPFGGFAEWIQRASFWKRTQKALGLGIKLPESLAQYGLLFSVGMFLLLTWIEEFFNIAGPGVPHETSYMVIGIVSSALLFFLVFERRTFCRYFCPLTAVIGTVGTMGSVAGFRTKDRDVCVECKTKDCMRGGENGYGCPWYTWPGSADSNLTCGLCSECYKACPSDNVGLFLQRPLTSLVAPRRRRPDVAWAVAGLLGLVLFQQINATSAYTTLDGALNKVMSFPQYPNPIDYLGIIGAITAALGGIGWLMSRAFARRDLVFTGGGRTFIDKTSKFRAYFVPMMYGLVPVTGADYFARQLPKALKHASRLVPSVAAWFGDGSTKSYLYNYRILSNPHIVLTQLVVVGLGLVGSVWATWRISGRELAPISAKPLAARFAVEAMALATGGAILFLYVIMHAAS
ncbi:MAG: 4Fe-4S binding protein [Actinomycetota bacterium]|nr:4Fe-4S binding protein [Actinomycetota bacterium]